MCIIIRKPAGRVISKFVLANCFAFNPDGWGLMFQDSTGVIVRKGSNFDLLVQEIDELTNEDLFLHFRKATVGDVTWSNIHPFRVGQQIWMMHNGTIKHIPVDKGESDSSALAKILRGIPPATLFNDEVQLLLRHYIGNSKLVLMSPSSALIVNHEQWFQHDGLMFSNRYATTVWTN